MECIFTKLSYTDKNFSAITATSSSIREALMHDMNIDSEAHYQSAIAKIGTANEQQRAAEDRWNNEEIEKNTWYQLRDAATHEINEAKASIRALMQHDVHPLLTPEALQRTIEGASAESLDFSAFVEKTAEFRKPDGLGARSAFAPHEWVAGAIHANRVAHHGAIDYAALSHTLNNSDTLVTQLMQELPLHTLTNVTQAVTGATAEILERAALVEHGCAKFPEAKACEHMQANFLVAADNAGIPLPASLSETQEQITR